MIVVAMNEVTEFNEIEAVAYYGPFDDLTSAISWIENDCPDDERDIATVARVRRGTPVNDPKSIFGDDPDEDIRDDDDEPG